MHLRKTTTVGCLGIVLLLVGGCGAVPRAAGFDDVTKTISDRTGKQIHWNQGTPSDQAVEASVRSMLAKELSADEAVQIALLNNRHLQATYEDLMVAQADLVSAGLLRNPVFDAEIRIPASGHGGTGLEMALVQDFIDVFYIPLRQRLAGAAFAAAKARVAGEVLGLAGDVRSAFYTLQASNQLLELRRQVLTATEASYDIAQRLRAAGNTRDLDLLTEQALYEQAKLDVRSAEAQMVQDREQINRLMGLWGQPAAEWKAVARLPEVPSEDTIARAVEAEAVANSLELEAGRSQIEVASKSLGIAVPFGYFSEAEIGASAEREHDGEWAVGPAFSLPVPLFNQGQPAVATAQAELRRARQRYAAIAIDVRSQARAANDAVITAREQADFHRKVLLPLRQKIVEQTQLQYSAMQVSPLQLLQAKQQQIDAGAAYIRALRTYWVARTELDQILSGRLPSGGRTRIDASETSSLPAGGRGGH